MIIGARRGQRARRRRSGGRGVKVEVRVELGAGGVSTARRRIADRGRRRRLRIRDGFLGQRVVEVYCVQGFRRLGKRIVVQAPGFSDYGNSRRRHVYCTKVLAVTLERVAAGIRV